MDSLRERLGALRIQAGRHDGLLRFDTRPGQTYIITQ